MRSLQKHFSLILLSIFTVFSLVVAPQVSAVGGPPVLFNGIANLKAPQDYLKEYCDKRSGDLMNLETWFSGKCGPGTDTLSGDGVGFVDIVMLQGFEWVYGPQYDNFLDGIIKIFKLLQEIQSKFSAGQMTINDLAFVDLGNTGIIGSLGRLTATLITVRPASSIDYIAYVGNNLKKNHVISPAYAAGPGYGYSALAPILPIWRAFRNISYLLFAFGFVLYGIMIMFRVRIDSKTAATIQLAIPKLIATLLMITFSYAIVGLLVDISTIAVAMSINVLKAGGILTEQKNILPAIASGQTALSWVGSLILNMMSAVVVSPFIFFNLIFGGIAGIVIAVVAGGLSLLNGMGLIMGVIVILAVGISYIKLVLKLFQAFISVVINLMFAPIILLGNLFPSSTSFADWLRSIYGNLAVFPVACFFLTLSYALMCQPLLSLEALAPGIGGAISQALSGNNVLENLLGVKSLSTLGIIWTPPLTMPLGGGTITSGGASTGNILGSGGSLMLATIGFGLLLMSSKYVEMVEKALKTPPFPYGAAIGEALKFGSQGNNWLAMRNYFGAKAPSGTSLGALYGPAPGASQPTIGRVPGGTTITPPKP